MRQVENQHSLLATPLKQGLVPSQHPSVHKHKQLLLKMLYTRCSCHSVCSNRQPTLAMILLTKTSSSSGRNL
jgi:hypothetical protein